MFFAHGFAFAGFDFWLAEMIQHENLIGMAVDESSRRRTIAARKSRRSNARLNSLRSETPRLKSSRDHQLLIGFILEHVAHAAQFGIRPIALQVLLHAFGSQRHPSHDPANKLVFVGDAQQPVRLFQRLPGLHGNHAVHARGLDGLAQILRQQNRGGSPTWIRRSIHTRPD